MTTEQKNIEIALFLKFELSTEENDWSSNPFYCPPKWFMDAVNCDYEVESVHLAFDFSYDWQLTAIDWIEEKDKSPYYFEIAEKSCYIYNIDTITDTNTNPIFSITAKSKKEAIFESLYWLSQNYKNYL